MCANASVMLWLAAVSFSCHCPDSHMTDRVAFTHAMRASHQADISDREVPGGPNMVMWALYDQVRTESEPTFYLKLGILQSC